jgi:kinesin family protein 18/19
LRDLLCPSHEVLDIREDPQTGIHVTGLYSQSVQNAQEVLQLLRLGNENRTVEATKANETSSRSHAVLQIVIEKIEST